MSRNIDAAYITESLKDSIKIVTLVELDFSGGMVRLNTSDRIISFQGNDYLGVGNLGTISSISEGADLSAKGLSLELSGVPATNVAIALGEYYQGRDCRVWVGFLDSDYALIESPVLMFYGYMDNMNIGMGKTATIKVSVESKFVDWRRPRVKRYTHEEQIIEFPNDLGLEFVAEMAEKEIIWGR